MHHDKSIKTALCKSTAKLKSLEVSSFKKESKNATDTSKKAFEHLKLAGPYANLECTIVWLWCMRRQILEALRCSSLKDSLESFEYQLKQYQSPP
jgi:hypothetical protein